MEKRHTKRPDSIDQSIIAFVQERPLGATIPEINRGVCPGRRENFVRYRITTLHEAGYLRETRIYNRVVVFPVDTPKNDEVGADA